MKCFILMATLLAVTQPAYSQIFTLRERDPNGRTYIVSGRTPVDINSQLEIQIQQDSIEAIVNEAMGSDTSNAIDELIHKLNLYRDFIVNLESTSREYAALFDPSQPTIDFDRLQTALEDRAIAGLEVLANFPEDSRFGMKLEHELNFVGDKGTTEQFLLLIRLLAEEVQFIENDLAALRNEAGYTFQLAAWINTRQGIDSIHLPGFDEIAPGEFYEFQRNQFSLTEEQLNELESLNSFFESVEAADVFGEVIDMLPDLATNLVDVASVTSAFDALKSSAESLTSTAMAEKKKLLTSIAEVEISWNAIKSKLQAVKRGNAQPVGISKVGLIKSFMDDASAIGQAVQLLDSDIRGMILAINFIDLGEGANGVKKQFENFADTLKGQVDQLINHARSTYHLAVYGREINATALILSEEVLELAIDMIPPGTTLDLLYTGKRHPGDVIAIKALIKQGDQVVPVHEEVIQFPVMNALPHVHMNVVYTFAKPNDADSNWKGGPLVSLLYKFKSRSLAYRNFLDPGIGIHAASYDFNNDDTPEFAGGAVLSMFKDYVQGGWGFNFNANRGYWFAGLRIPIPTSPIALSGNTN